jgi:Cys-tRNA(Pro) deacylase
MLSKSAEAVQQALVSKGLAFKVVELSASTRTANEAAEAIGCQVAQIVKSLVFCTQTSQKPILVLASGANRVNEKTIAQLVGEKIQKADAEFTRNVTGYAIGGIPPLGHKQNIDTYIDEDLLNLIVLWAAAGTPHAVFELRASDLERVSNGIVVSVK